MFQEIHIISSNPVGVRNSKEKKTELTLKLSCLSVCHDHLFRVIEFKENLKTFLFSFIHLFLCLIEKQRKL